MKKLPKIYDLLALNQAERSITRSCGIGFLSIADLAKKTRLPRMTIHDNLQSLARRGLLLKQKTGKRVLYGVRDVESIFATNSKKSTSLIKTQSGRNALIKIWQKITLLPPRSRVYLLQPETSLRQSTKKVPSVFIEKLHKEHLKKTIIIDCIATEDEYNFLKDSLSTLAFSSMKDRATEVRTLSRSLFKNNAVEMVILPRVAYLSDWKNEMCLEIREPGMVDFLKEMYEICKSTTRRINHIEVIKSKLSS